MLKLMYITNKPWVARIAEDAGVDWIFIDMEFIGKGARQGGLDTVQNHHTIADIRTIKQSLKKAELLVRVNPIHEGYKGYPDSKEEIDEAIKAGADIVMLPFFKTVKEVKEFIRYVDGRAKTLLLVETAEAALLLNEIVELPGVDMIHIGLNDLHLELGMKFMFQPLIDGIVDDMATKIKAKGIPFGFGGLATLDGGAVPGSMILKEHYRLGSSMVIVSRSFCNTDLVTDEQEVKKIFDEGIGAIRDLEKEVKDMNPEFFAENHLAVKKAVLSIIS